MPSQHCLPAVSCQHFSSSPSLFRAGLVSTRAFLDAKEGLSCQVAPPRITRRWGRAKYYRFREGLSAPPRRDGTHAVAGHALPLTRK